MMLYIVPRSTLQYGDELRSVCENVFVNPSTALYAWYPGGNVELCSVVFLSATFSGFLFGIITSGNKNESVSLYVITTTGKDETIRNLWNGQKVCL